MKGSSVIARKYASALADLVLDQSILDQLALLRDLINSDFDFRNFLANPSIQASAKKKFLLGLLQSQFSGELIALLSLLVDKRRLALIPDLYDAYLEIFFAKSNIALVELYSTQSVDQALIDELSSKLSKALNKSVELLNQVDTSLIAGYKLKIENKVLDLTLRTKMREVQELLI